LEGQTFEQKVQSQRAPRPRSQFRHGQDPLHPIGHEQEGPSMPQRVQSGGGGGVEQTLLQPAQLQLAPRAALHERHGQEAEQPEGHVHEGPSTEQPEQSSGGEGGGGAGDGHTLAQPLQLQLSPKEALQSGQGQEPTQPLGHEHEGPSMPQREQSGGGGGGGWTGAGT
jgi:hypothetical protein